ncbi:MAG: PBP1A family penicillin-binding protein [Clostridiales bacterium]|nr:PBP1A family penicillin-binding protein [Clostridiales bacterium]
MENQNLSAIENRVWVSYNEIPKNLVNAFIAIEDKRFESHHGVDWIRTLSATANFFMPGGKSYGGSTITQQVIKNVTGYDDVTIQRKVQEIFMALNLEKKLDKSEILEIYLNTIYLSQRSYGVQAAAKTYFGKDVSELTLVECAAIASITQAPTKWDPIQHPENNQDRRRAVLTQMYEQHKITEEEYRAAYDEELVLYKGKDSSSTGTSYNSWYTDQVINDSIELLVQQLGVSETVATSMIYTGGLRIYTLIDPAIQERLENVFKDENNFPSVAGSMQPKCSMVVIDPYTGDVLALVGDRGEKTGDRIQSYATKTQRSPGSSIKPLSIYAPALEEGVINYASVFDDRPVNYGDDNATPWPSNAPNVYGGLTTIHDAITRSVNTVSVRVLMKLGVETSFDYVKNKLHMDSFILSEETKSGYVISDMNYSGLALGGMSYGVTVLEMTAAYSMFANGGVYHKPRTVLKIEDYNGNVIVDNKAESNAVISETTSIIMTRMMEKVVSTGTAASSIKLDSQINVAGKTGTTNDDIDKWFIGYTPYYVGGVWFGYEWNKTLTGFPAASAAIVWNTAMTAIHEPVLNEINEGKAEKQFFPYGKDIVTAEYCRYSGKLVTEACKADMRGNAVETGYFTVSNIPTDKCDCHVLLDICKETGSVAREGCPSTEKIGFITVNRDDIPEDVDVKIGDASYVYHGGSYCSKHEGAVVGDGSKKR